jgi:hypothetical protein
VYALRVHTRPLSELRRLFQVVYQRFAVDSLCASVTPFVDFVVVLLRLLGHRRREFKNDQRKTTCEEGDNDGSNDTGEHNSTIDMKNSEEQEGAAVLWTAGRTVRVGSFLVIFAREFAVAPTSLRRPKSRAGSGVREPQSH